MKNEIGILLAVLLVSGCSAVPPAKSPPQAKAPAVGAHSMPGAQNSEQPSAEHQARVMNEAKKLSFACRMFRTLYGRWPRDLAEIQAKTDGIIYEVFEGRAVVTPLPDDSEKIEIFDGVSTRAVKVTPVNFQVIEATREAAKTPDFKIKL